METRNNLNFPSRKIAPRAGKRIQELIEQTHTNFKFTTNFFWLEELPEANKQQIQFKGPFLLFSCFFLNGRGGRVIFLIFNKN